MKENANMKKDEDYRVSVFASILETAETISEALGYCQNSDVDKEIKFRLKEDIESFFSSMQSTLININIEDKRLEKLILKAKQTSLTNGNFLEIKQDLEIILNSLFYQNIARNILELKSIKSSDAITYLFFLGKCTTNKYDIEGLLCLKLAIATQSSHPVESFRGMNKAFELDPNLDSKINGNKGYKFHPKIEQYYFEQCPVCQSIEATPHFNAFGYTMVNFSRPFLPAKLWLKCTSCENLYSYAFPKEYINTPNKIEIISPDPNNINNISDHVSYLHLWNRILNKVSLFTGGKDILEVGIGNGEFIAVALEMGYDVDALEISKDSCHRVANLLNVDIICCDFLKFDTDKKYSIISMGDVIEHVTDPTRALKKVAEMLKDDGVLWISTPNYESSFSRLRKFTDAMWCTNNHITYFSYNTFSKLLTDCGFEVLEYNVSERYRGSMELFVRKDNRRDGRPRKKSF